MTSKANNPPAEGERRRTAAVETNSKKPMRPLTAYHLFFQLEREYILQTTPAADGPSGGSAPPQIDDRLTGKDLDPMMPHRYRYIRLYPTWYASGSSNRTGGKAKRRKHRKTHGKIGFLDLSKRIAARWAALDENDWATKEYVTRIAGRELEAYRRKVEEHKKKNETSADLKVDSMDADEMKHWIEGAGGISSGGMPTDGVGEAIAEAIATATPPENIAGRAAAAMSCQSQPAMTSFPLLKPEAHNMPYMPAKSMPSTNYQAAVSNSEEKPADLKGNPMGADEMKLWIGMASSRFPGGMQTKNEEEEAATAMLHENRDRATATSCSQSQATMSSFPWMNPEVNSVPYPSMALMPPLNCEATSSDKTDTDASIGRIGGAIEGNQQLLDSNPNCTAGGTARMPITASVETLENDAFNELSFNQAIPSFGKQFHIADKGGRRRHSFTSDLGIQIHWSEPSSSSFPKLGSLTPALYGNGQREGMMPVPLERVRHSFTSSSSPAPSLCRRGGGGNSGQGNAHRGVSEMNDELDAFLAGMGRSRDQGQGRGFDFGGIAPIGHRPANADDARNPLTLGTIEAIKPPPVGLEDDGVSEMNYELDAFLSRTGQQQGQGQGRGIDFEGGGVSIGHHPMSASNDACAPLAMEALGLENTVGMARITPEDAVGLMEALSDYD